MGGKAVKNILVSVVLFLVMTGCVFYGAIFIFKNVYKPAEKDWLTLNEENNKVREESRKLDPEEGKIVLTEEVLASEYRFTYEDNRAGKNSDKTFVYLAAGFFLFVFAFSFVSVFYASHFSFRKSCSLLIPMILIVGALWFLERKGVFKDPPKPEEVSYRLDSVEITRKRWETVEQRDEDGHVTSTSKRHYVYYKGANGIEHEYPVTEMRYNEIAEHGLFYLASAVSEDEVIPFMLYETEKYKPAK